MSIGSNIVFIRVSLILTFLLYASAAQAYVNTQLKNFSHPEPFIRSSTKVAAVVIEEPRYDPGDALLWSAPPYRQLAKSLALVEEQRRKQEALALLVASAYEHNMQLAAARSKLKRSQITKLGAQILGKLNSESGSEAETYIRKTISELNKQFNIYSESYFKSSREQEWLARIETARAYLVYNCSQASLDQVDQIYLGDNHEIISDTVL